MTAPPEPPPPARRVAAWWVLGGAGLLALLGAPVGLSIVVALLAVAIAATYRNIARHVSAASAAGAAPVLDATPGVPRGQTRGADVVTSSFTEARARATPEGVDDVDRMTDQELCHAWRVSYVRLRRLQQLPYLSEATVRVAMERSGYLDELERRYPQGFAAWMAAGARAPSDPSRYLTERTARPRQDPES